MGKCIYCGNLSNNAKRATLHRFPRNAELCKQWVKLIGRENWMPTNSSLLCSDHFPKDCFTVYYNRKFLKPESLPTILTQCVKMEEVFQERSNTLVESNHRNINECIIKSENVPEAGMSVECINSPTSGTLIFNQEGYIQPSTSKLNVMESNPMTIQEKIRHDHHYGTTPRGARKKLSFIQQRLENTVKSKKMLMQKLKRLKIKVQSLKEVVKGLKEQRLLPENAYYNFLTLENTSLELFNRIVKNRKGKVSRDKYPPSLRAFALTVHFYSPKAYNYIRNTFDLALPHADVLRTWYTSVDAEPGFTDESFNTLKEKSEALKKNGEKLVCSVIIDEMGIKKGCQRGRDGRMRGHVDFGAGIIGSDDLLEANNAFVIMVVPLVGNWKLPIAYFLINALNGETKANLVREAFIRLHKVGITVCCITLDGPSDHFSMVEKLGAKMRLNESVEEPNIFHIFKVNFPHPVPGEPDINVMFDPCHMIKNVRNCLGEYNTLVDGDGRTIEWRYVESLALLQQREGLSLGNRLHLRHIEYKKMMMKVSIAAQTLSASVADSLEFCSHVLHIPEFEGCEATSRFIRCINTLFDFLNVRNPWGKYLKSPLRRNNEDVWRPRLISELTYLSNIKQTDGTSIFRSRRKAGFIGFFTAVLSTFNIFDTYVKPIDSKMQYLLTYKMSQDHLELFFCAIRGRSGWCPNPTALQFVSAFKRLLVRHDIKINTGNVQALDNTKILNVSSSTLKKTAKVDRYDLNVYNETHNMRTAEKYGLTTDFRDMTLISEVSKFLSLTWAQSLDVSEFSQQAVGYIAGWVILSLKKKKIINCTECIVACEGHSNSMHISKDNPVSYIAAITQGYLTIPSDSVVKICLVTEMLFRRACRENSGKPPIEQNFPCVLAVRAFEQATKNYDLFLELEQHDIEMFSVDEFISHTNRLIKTIVKQYVELRMYAATKQYASATTGTNLRHFLTRTIIWAHQ